MRRKIRLLQRVSVYLKFLYDLKENKGHRFSMGVSLRAIRVTTSVKEARIDSHRIPYSCCCKLRTTRTYTNSVITIPKSLPLSAIACHYLPLPSSTTYHHRPLLTTTVTTADAISETYGRRFHEWNPRAIHVTVPVKIVIPNFPPPPYFFPRSSNIYIFIYKIIAVPFSSFRPIIIINVNTKIVWKTLDRFSRSRSNDSSIFLSTRRNWKSFFPYIRVHISWMRCEAFLERFLEKKKLSII